MRKIKIADQNSTDLTMVGKVLWVSYCLKLLRIWVELKEDFRKISIGFLELFRCSFDFGMLLLVGRDALNNFELSYKDVTSS